jgi:branched-chain amino acid transport system permease protein
MVLFMAYIGGIGSFLGPIIGAVSLTYLDTMLSDITEAWVLYYGIIFVLVIAFAPQGIAGLILMHEPIVRNKPFLLKKLIFPYTIFTLSILILVIGFTTLIELIHSLKSSHSHLTIYWIKISNTNVLVWFASIFLAVIGVFLCRKSYFRTKEVWDDIIENIKMSFIR